MLPMLGWVSLSKPQGDLAWLVLHMQRRAANKASHAVVDSRMYQFAPMAHQWTIFAKSSTSMLCKRQVCFAVGKCTATLQALLHDLWHKGLVHDPGI